MLQKYLLSLIIGLISVSSFGQKTYPIELVKQLEGVQLYLQKAPDETQTKFIIKSNSGNAMMLYWTATVHYSIKDSTILLFEQKVAPYQQNEIVLTQSKNIKAASPNQLVTRKVLNIKVSQVKMIGLRPE